MLGEDLDISHETRRHTSNSGRSLLLCEPLRGTLRLWIRLIEIPPLDGGQFPRDRADNLDNPGIVQAEETLNRRIFLPVFPACTAPVIHIRLSDRTETTIFDAPDTVESLVVNA